ncbi:HAMP domain-containing histidine kinase [Pediococcus ethanolidurans]|uniref:sensor histidine kinase n=1 Tax=Pediococcus ethanolidurans TaxID=319653 RepID=UPI001C1EE5AD|nr:HAMP domain-containing sensor histidine kinase [Pediococcus ethanolidurans]MBU7554069.1 HAMP domain-containing histidine kinase [Pediococcus ethanolidurans]MBU7564137.1 HAMP domain-containing histidine kinase [Pediococcus ethanolidurans]MCT4398688.1 sensor histidine kinase [Pediococcus ethanolidurans]MCV3314660.1 HAMP domain-containing histidine kinase [Pediococcus ethanolidurans]MCV3322058.1 HAMP domain-containing histidine kinase [Pediococcus ethanolidurans]
MDKIVNRKQQIKLFLLEFFSFLIVFSILGTILFVFYQRNTYTSIDNTLSRRATMSANSTNMMGPPDFQTITIYYNAKGKIVNSQNLSNMSSTVAKIKVNKSELNKIYNIELGSVTMRGVYLKVNSQMMVNRQGKTLKKSQQPKYALVLKNITPEIQSINRFKNLLLASLIVFGLIVFIISYIISRINMKPVLKAWKQQEEFVDSAAHEIRTPLTIIQNKLEGLMTKPNDTIKNQVGAIIMSLSEIRRLNGLTSDMLTLARANSNVITLDKAPVDFSSFMSEILEPYKDLIKSEDKKLVTAIDVNKPVLVDAKRVHQLIVILLDNAIKYTPKGATITVNSNIENRNLKIQICDTGIGIRDKNKKSVFKRFYREEKSGNKQTGGNGLGLSIAEWIVRAHKGKIKVTDNPGGGTIFTVLLPVAK